MPVDLTLLPYFSTTIEFGPFLKYCPGQKLFHIRDDVVMYRRVAIKVTTELFSSEVGGSEKNPLRLVFWIEIRFDRLER